MRGSGVMNLSCQEIYFLAFPVSIFRRNYPVPETEHYFENYYLS